MTGPELKAARLTLGLTQEGLAERAGLSVGTIARYEMKSNQGRFAVPKGLSLLITLWLTEKGSHP